MKHVILMFLSTVRKNNEAYYKDIEREEVSTKTTNESAIRWLIKHEFNGDADKISRIFIMASKMVRKKIEEDNPQTHLDYFKETIKNFVPNLEDCIPADAVYNFDEDGSADRNLMSVAGIASEIQQFAAETNDAVTLHVDLTGGMRHINMIMLDVIRLLEYSGIKIGRLLYSNLQTKLVEEVKNIYSLFQLISGVEEFVQFGSVKALKNYYDAQDQNTLSPKLNRLIRAMENFSDEIKLCHYGQFRQAIIELHDAVHDFEADENNAQDMLMARLIDRIREDYRELLKTRELDDLKVIRWCIDNDYMQQALTLYTERLPEYIGEHDLLKLAPADVKKLDDKVRKDDMHRNRWFYFINEYSSSYSNDQFRTAAIKIYFNEIKDNALLAIRKNKFDYDEWWSNLSARLEEGHAPCTDEARLRVQMKLFEALRADATPLMTPDDPMLDPIREIINKLSAQLEDLQKPKERFNRILQFLQTEIKSDEINKYFPDLQERFSCAARFPKALPIYRMLCAKVFEVDMSDEQFLSIMDKYFRLKDERNHSNHARADSGEFKTAPALKEFMLSGLDELTEVINRQ